MRKISKAEEQYTSLNFRTAGFADPINDITTRGFDASEGTDRGGHVNIVFPTHTCDIGNHEVKGDVTCAERYCMSRKRGEGTWDQHGHQNWSHNYACAEHMPEFGPRKGGPGPSLDHPEHVWKPEDTIASKTASDKPWDDKDPDGGKHHKLSPEQKAKAKARAKAHGRPYPNWVDNAWASKQ